MKDKEIIDYEHTKRMEELNFIRETERLKHEWDKERMRIKSAEIRRAEERRGNRTFAETTRHS